MSIPIACDCFIHVQSSRRQLLNCPQFKILSARFANKCSLFIANIYATIVLTWSYYVNGLSSVLDCCCAIDNYFNILFVNCALFL